VFRVPVGSMPLDHTSILATVEHRFGVPALTLRDAAAPDVGNVLSEATPRTDDPLAGVTPPVSGSTTIPADAPPSHLLQVNADLVAGLPVAGQHLPTSKTLAPLHTGADYTAFINHRTAQWRAGRTATSAPPAAPPAPVRADRALTEPAPAPPAPAPPEEPG